MIGPVETALKAKLAAIVTDWPIRWPNESWPAGTITTQGGLPTDAEGNPVPFIEAKVIGGADSADIAPAGMRHSLRDGLFRIYLCVGQGTGTDAITAKTDTILPAFKRKTIFYDQTTKQRLITMDGRPDDGVAAYEDATRFVRMISIPWTFDYLS